MPTALLYQSIICVAGAPMSCIESYESLLERLRDARIQADENSDDSLAFRFAGMLEITVRGPDEKPLRMAVAPAAVSYVQEIRDEDRVEVAE